MSGRVKNAITAVVNAAFDCGAWTDDVPDGYGVEPYDKLLAVSKAAQADLLAAIAEAVAEEREACAKVADSRTTDYKLDPCVDTGRIWSNATAKEIAAAIRSRTPEQP